MFKQAFRLTFITFIWKQYKSVIVSTFFLFLFLWVVGFAHQEYLDFAQNNAEKSSVAGSFFIKWGAMLVGIFSYFAYHYFRSRKSPRAGVANFINAGSGTESSEVDTDSKDDPFYHIRRKDKLRSRAEIMIEKDKQ